MTTRIEADIAGVAAFIVAKNSDEELFLGVSHARSKKASGKLGAGLQLSIPTETIEESESDESALHRLLDEEEVYIEGLSHQDNLAGRLLYQGFLSGDFGVADFHVYLLFADRKARITIMDGELEEAGWVPLDTVSNAPKKECWWLRPSVSEAVETYRRWQKDSGLFHPPVFSQLRNGLPPEVFGLMKSEGVNETEALSRLGLHSPYQSRPWDFVR